MSTFLLPPLNSAARNRLRSLMLDEFHKYCLPLSFVFRRAGSVEFESKAASGFLLHFEPYHLWVTAGHVLTQLYQGWHSGEVEERRSSLVDAVSEVPDVAWSIPFDPSTCRYELLGDEDDDIGVIVLRELYVSALNASPEKQFLQREVLEDGALPPQMFLLLGAPAERLESEIEHGSTGPRLKTRVISARLELAPAQRPESARLDSDFYDVLDEANGEPLVKNLDGMSGGPVFSVALGKESGSEFVLQGVQSAVVTGTRVVRVMNRETLFRLLEKLQAE